MEIGQTQQKILGAMFLILVICLSLITFATSRKTTDFPPTTNQCPDFFSFDGTSCVPPEGIYPSTGANYVGSIDIMSAGSPYLSTKSDSLCKKKGWAVPLGVTWDGITNNSEIVAC